MAKLTQAYLKKILNYDPDTGIFTWLVIRGKGRIGAVAGRDGHGYVVIGIDGKVYYAHRLAWLYVNGVFPKNTIDHKDLCRNNNAWANLRGATQSQNSLNKPIRTDNTSGYKGVSWSKCKKKWRAAIGFNGKYIHLGYCDSSQEAHQSYCIGAAKYHGDFSRNS